MQPGPAERRVPAFMAGDASIRTGAPAALHPLQPPQYRRRQPSECVARGRGPTSCGACLRSTSSRALAAAGASASSRPSKTRPSSPRSSPISVSPPRGPPSSPRVPRRRPKGSTSPDARIARAAFTSTPPRVLAALRSDAAAGACDRASSATRTAGTRRFVCVWQTAVQRPTSDIENYVTPADTNRRRKGR